MNHTSTSAPVTAPSFDEAALHALARRIRTWGQELGFGAVGISNTDLSDAEARLAEWLAAGYHGEMDYMAKHGMKRARPAELVTGTLRVISVRLDYLPASMFADEGADQAVDTAAGEAQQGAWRARSLARLDEPGTAVVSMYARGRDYHKVLRNRLQTLAERIEGEIGSFGYRVFTDSAPVLEVELATRAQLGWRGKHTLLLTREAGSCFFLGEIYVDLPLPVDAPVTHSDPGSAETPAVGHCGQCTRCIDICPTQAIVAPYKVDARRCISYLTIELQGSIPESLRPLIGNRVYGCDDCQLICPWNKFAQAAPIDDFDVRNGLDHASLLELFAWTEVEFDERLRGSPIRRIGHERWLRNLAVGLGNALRADPAKLAPGEREAMIAALRSREHDTSPLVREHVTWALQAA